jgi:hypothetical protein
LYRLRSKNSVAGSTVDGSVEATPESDRRRDGLLIVRAAVGLGLVLAQLVMVLVAHLSNCCQERYFVWAPNDYSIDYRINTTVNGWALSSSEIGDRYRLPQAGFYEDPVERLESVLRRRELAYGRSDRVDIALVYELNGRPPAEWRWSNG